MTAGMRSVWSSRWSKKRLAFCRDSSSCTSWCVHFIKSRGACPWPPCLDAERMSHWTCITTAPISALPSRSSRSSSSRSSSNNNNITTNTADLTSVENTNWSGTGTTHDHLDWPRLSYREHFKEGDEAADRGNDGKTTSKSGPALNGISYYGKPRTARSGGSWLENLQWCPNGQPDDGIGRQMPFKSANI